MSKPIAKRLSARPPLPSGPRERRRSIPEVDVLPPRVREQLTAAALSSNRAQLDELRKVHVEVRSQRQLMIATLATSALVAIAITVIAVVGAVRISSAERRIDSVERRLERVEKTVFQPEEKP